MKRSLVLLVTFGFLTLSGLAKADGLVTNGGFETGDFTGWTTTAAPDGGGNFGVNNVNPHSGTYNAFFGASLLDFDLIQQNLNTTAGQQYNLSFWLNVSSNNDPSNDFQALWNGAVVTDVTSATEAWGSYTQYTALVSGTGSDSLEFQGYNAASFDFLDDVTVTSASGAVAATPEPASLLLSGLALLALPGIKRLRRR